MENALRIDWVGKVGYNRRNRPSESINLLRLFSSKLILPHFLDSFRFEDLSTILAFTFIDHNIDTLQVAGSVQESMLSVCGTLANYDKFAHSSRVPRQPAPPESNEPCVVKGM